MSKRSNNLSRRIFIQGLTAGSVAAGGYSLGAEIQDQGDGKKNFDWDELPRDAYGNVIPGFGKEKTTEENSLSIEQKKPKKWEPVSDRKIKVGIAGFGLCQFGARFFYQNHPNVEVVAATDLDRERCRQLAKAVGAEKTYPSCEDMIRRDKEIEAVFVATDAPSHANLAIMALNHGKHVVSAVPAVFGWKAKEESEKLLEAVKKSGLKYMMNETSTFHADLYEKRIQYQAGALGRIIYSEGEYWHDGVGTLAVITPRTARLTNSVGVVAYHRCGIRPMQQPTTCRSQVVAD